MSDKHLFFLMAVPILLIGVPFGATAQQIDFQFQVYKLDTRMADALQSRVLDGGEPAVQAISKMPDFVRQRRASLEAEVTIQAKSGDRTKGASSNRKLKVGDDFMEVTDGLSVEIDPVASPSGSTLDLVINAQFSQKAGSYRQLSTALVAAAGVPVLLSRWQEGEEILLFIGTGKLPAPGTPGVNPQHQIYVDAAFYESEADAQAQRNPVVRVVFPTRSGQRAKIEHMIPIDFEIGGAKEMFAGGWSVEGDPVLSDAVVDLNCAFQYTKEGGGSERSENRDNVPRLKIHQAIGAVKLKTGQREILGSNLSSLADAAAKPDSWKAAVTCQIREVR